MDLNGKVVVITGASSGIGRAAALQFANKGAKLVLGARDSDALMSLVEACHEDGAEAMAFSVDVSEEAEVIALRDAAFERFGHIDVWVNNAAAYLVGRVDQVPSDAVRRLFEINFMGVVHGSKAALEEFERRGSGVLINVGSVAGKAPYAHASAYCATKHAVHGFTHALRQELAGTDIHACIVAPHTVDTPLFEHAANFSGRVIEAMRPIYSPERVAAAVVSCAQRPRREVIVGTMPRVMASFHRTMPLVYERVEPKMVERDHLGDEPAPDSVGNLFCSMEPHRIEGGWKERKSLRKLTPAGAFGSVVLLGFGLYAARGALVSRPGQRRLPAARQRLRGAVSRMRRFATSH